MVLDSFIKTSATGGLGSIKAEVMADTAVALASGNVKLVSSKVRPHSAPLTLDHERVLMSNDPQLFVIIKTKPFLQDFLIHCISN